ncbi:MAG: hypothetical protein A2X61_08590 [Ignavibacteria bacterium GWB2_35_12]|nr:MAG: hypothetical protein A2X63_08280 [Ignavibacteria bacterium GWA2_35_8]OGU40682.1 MAG: hypothetical protein A2X61_08590 [Ignavibacteria bacterium GWB2_35_12]OGU96329.1 MAG: hypothetical protein A2220_03445 [Ignavibacteria bacterium RIFOXYA2_FULL_35_10]OGV22413.1 MAG: hypothetical protein A2475_16025 [Ignavibacteria bacterium RIFOXYC2_FULL_35_21]
MKKTFYILFFFIFFFLTFFQLEAQSVDTLGIVTIDNVIQVKPDTIMFDLKLIRSSDKWDRFANGTFEITIADTSFPIHPDSCTVQFIPGTSEFKLATFSGGGQLPVTDYYITANVYPGRLSITIAGPEEYVFAHPIPTDTTVLIGQFLLASKTADKMIPKAFAWLNPQYYYQACAYKIEKDSLLAPNVIRYHENDNVEMDDSLSNTVTYKIDESPEPEFILDSFVVEYAGKKRVHIWWTTLKEAYNSGFVLKRALMGPWITDTNAADWQTIARYDGPRLLDQGLIGNGTSSVRHKYDYSYDTVKYRSADYCYRLYYVDFFDTEHFLAQGCTRIPNAVITKAHPYPNPFKDKTTIEVFLEDNVMLTATVYDLKGREMEKLKDEKGDLIAGIEASVGKHLYEFQAGEFASQGLYDVIFIAYPIEDPSIEISRAVVKLQLIR